MDKNIYELQNKDTILKALVVQSKVYNKAKRINYILVIFTRFSHFLTHCKTLL
jgi:hypothetical protein